MKTLALSSISNVDCLSKKPPEKKDHCTDLKPVLANHYKEKLPPKPQRSSGKYVNRKYQIRPPLQLPQKIVHSYLNREKKALDLEISRSSIPLALDLELQIIDTLYS